MIKIVSVITAEVIRPPPVIQVTATGLDRKEIKLHLSPADAADLMNKLSSTLEGFMRSKE